MRPRFRHRRPQEGQSSVEYAIVCAALAIALGVGMSGETSVFKQLLAAFKSVYQDFSHAISLPG